MNAINTNGIEMSKQEIQSANHITFIRFHVMPHLSPKGQNEVYNGLCKHFGQTVVKQWLPFVPHE